MVLDLRKEMRTKRRMPRKQYTSSDVGEKTIKKSLRKTRNKTRKPKYLSLRLRYFSTDQKLQESTEIPTTTSSAQLNLFPLHPENLVEEKDAHDENVAILFSAADGGATTLNGVLGAASTSSSDEDMNKNHSTTTTLSASDSLTFAYGRRVRDSEEEVALVKTAMRNKEREPSEEKWVSLSEVVERRGDEEVSSRGAADLGGCWRNQRLSLKLDYEEILNAWSDKGPLYIHGAVDSPQTVPDIHDHFLASDLSNGINDGWGNSGGCVWRVPELLLTSKGNELAPILIEVKAEEQQEQAMVKAAGQREASVQRYKEKRQNRLFSKKIRYEVRKLNADKRPRLKGRFVKRD
ncbi:hypothetical protein ACH5RR_011012 [Cinchona calisaya]|uniref:CCT domain-containing protein n=1 Tax=Cinchona calisaya TaxID=153742 RepID=A0ABD3A3N3_9GENT